MSGCSTAILRSIPLRGAHLLTLLRECRAIRHLKQIHSLLVTSGLSRDASCNAQILHVAALSLPGDIAYASLVLHQTETSDASMWNTLVRGYSLRSHHDKAISQFTQMLRLGVVPDEHTYPLVLKVLSRLGNIDPDQVHAQILKVGFFSDNFVQNSLVSSYAKCGNLASARNLFDAMLSRDPIPWTAMIHGYSEDGQASDALALFIMMRSSGVQVDEVAIVSVLNGCASLGNVWLGRCVHGFYMVCGRVKWDVFIGSALVDMYAKCGYYEDARKLFDEMPVGKNVVTWSTMIAGYVQCNRCIEALSLFNDMLIRGQTPNEATLASVLTSCAQIGALHQGRWIHGYVKRSKLEENSVVGTALIDMYAKCGSIVDAVVAFKDIKHKDVYPWTALINGLAIHGCALECLDFFSQMIKDGVQPNEVTFIGLLSACSHRALVGQGRFYFNSMSKDYGIRPKMEHYGCMVDLLGRAGMLEEALLLIGSMPIRPSSGVWGALLNACIIHKELELGERVGKLLVQMEPQHSGRYALLANLYSLSKKWHNCANIRLAMKRRRVEKIKGSSWIEINGILHEFIAMDDSHPESKDIYETLDGITTMMNLERTLSLVNSHREMVNLIARMKSCAYYMKTGSCKYGVACKFNHPQPVSHGMPFPVSGSSTYGYPTSVAPTSRPTAISGISPYPLSRIPYMSTPRLQGLPAYVPLVLSPTQGNMVLQQGWCTYLGEPVCTFYSTYGSCMYDPSAALFPSQRSSTQVLWTAAENSSFRSSKFPDQLTRTETATSNAQQNPQNHEREAAAGTHTSLSNTDPSPTASQ